MDTRAHQAISAAGGPVAVARALKITHAAVRKWATGQVPAERVLALSRLSGVPPHDLRPDLYPPHIVTSGIGTDTNHENVIEAKGRAKRARKGGAAASTKEQVTQ